MTAFCRCCCSGIISEPTVMPVRSSNSLWYLVSRSPRGLLTRNTSIFSPLKRFQSNAPCACAASCPAPGMAPSAAAPRPACSRRRRCRFRVLADRSRSAMVSSSSDVWGRAAVACAGGVSRRAAAAGPGIILHERRIAVRARRLWRATEVRRRGQTRPRQRLEQRRAHAVGERDLGRAHREPAGIARARGDDALKAGRNGCRNAISMNVAIRSSSAAADVARKQRATSSG